MVVVEVLKVVAILITVVSSKAKGIYSIVYIFMASRR